MASIYSNNRDEYFSRTFKEPNFHWDTRIFAGKDMLEGERG